VTLIGNLLKLESVFVCLSKAEVIREPLDFKEKNLITKQMIGFILFCDPINSDSLYLALD